MPTVRVSLNWWLATMTNDSEREAVELLQQLGLQEYEAKCFVALTRLASGTAKEISDIADVPQTRVYDAVRVLESEGLVGIQHSSPKRFRALSIEDAITLLSERYTSRIESLDQSLNEIDQQKESPAQSSQEVWSLSGRKSVAARTCQIITEADEEIILVVGSESVLTEELFDALDATIDRGVEVVLGAIASPTRTQIRERLPDAYVFETELDWLEGTDEDDPSIGVLLVVDRNVLLVSSQIEHGPDEDRTETAVFGSGFTNGLVVVARRLLTRGLLPVEDPAE